MTAQQPTSIDINLSGNQVTGVLPAANTTHAEPLTDGNANFIFAATLSAGGDIICVEGIQN